MHSAETPSPTGSVQRISKRSTYLKQKPKKHSRPGTADSDMHLVPKIPEISEDFTNPWATTSHSNIYNSYQYSLNSLQDILAWVRFFCDLGCDKNTVNLIFILFLFFLG